MMLRERSTSAASAAPVAVSPNARYTRTYIALDRRASARRSLITRRVYHTYDARRIRINVATNSSGLPRRMAFLAERVGTEIRPKHVGDGHAPIGVLVMLEDAGQRSRERQAASVQRVHEARLLALAGAIADV